MKRLLLYSCLILCSIPLVAMEEIRNKKIKTQEPPELSMPSLEPTKTEIALIEAAKEGNLEKVKELVAQHGSEVNIDAHKGGAESALSYASERGYLKIVEFLLEQGAHVNCKGYWMTPLHLASFEGHVDVVKVLLEHGADPTLLSSDEEGLGCTPLGAACGFSYQDDDSAFWGWLRDDANGQRLRSEKHLEVVKLLLEKHSPNNGWDCLGKNALQYAVLSGMYDAVKLLLDSDDTLDIDELGLEDEAPLHLALHYGLDDIALLLLERGAKWDWNGDKHEYSDLPTIAFLAAYGNCPRAMSYLILQGIDLTAKTDYDSEDLEIEEGNSPLDIAKARKAWDVAEVIKQGLICNKLAKISEAPRKKIFELFMFFKRLKLPKDVQWKIILGDKDLKRDLILGAACVKKDKQGDYTYIVETILKRCGGIRIKKEDILAQLMTIGL